MKRKRASEIFGGVDPHLKVINVSHGHSRKALGDWEASGGAVCSRCKQEAVRFRSRDGVCVQCVRELEEKQDREDEKRTKQLKFIKQHNARIEKKKGG